MKFLTKGRVRETPGQATATVVSLVLAWLAQACGGGTSLGGGDVEEDGTAEVPDGWDDRGADDMTARDDAPGTSDADVEAPDGEADSVGADADGDADGDADDAFDDAADAADADADEAEDGRDAADVVCVPTGPEVCNELDDDCDGILDDGLWCSVAPPWLTSDSRDLRGVWGTAPDDVWVVGSFGTIIHWDGTTWTDVPSGTTAHLEAVWCLERDDAWAVGEGGMQLRWDGSSWSGGAGDRVWLYGVHGTGADDVWIVGASGYVIHWNGSSWSGTTSWLTDDLHSVWALAPDDVWAVGCCSPVVHWDGVSWSRVPVGLMGTTANGVWGIGPDDLWVVGNIQRAEPDFGYAMLHGGGISWSRVPVDGGWWYDVWGASADDVWAVGINGFVGRWDGAGWTTVELAGMGGTYRAVWGSSAGDVWVVGDEKTILHFRE